MTSCRHTLPILIEYAWSMARVWLEYGWSMARVWLEYGYSEITAHSQRDYSSLSTRLRLTISLLLMLTLGSSSVWGQTLPFEVTTNDDITNQTEKLYWIESAGATGFYAVPHSNNSNASTTNAPTLRALWYFMESGEDGYYYIINKETGKYLKKTGNTGSDNTIGVADYAAADDAKFKFSFGTPTGIIEGYWVIYPKEAGTAGWLSKKSGNTQYGQWLKVSNWNNTPVGDAPSQWKIVARDAVQWPQSGLPFVVSTSNNKNYYRINHAQNTYYNISYDANNYVTISTEYDNNTAWYFKEAATDPSIDNLKYYYIVNASSGKYLKFTATNINGSNQTDKFTLSDYVEGDADRFQFVVVNSYGGNAKYSIMPKLAMSKYDVSNYANSMVPSSVANNEKLDLRSDRNNANAHWNFVPTVYPLSCSSPVITYSSETGKITITTTTSTPSIYYTTDGTEPSSTNGELYSEPFNLSSETTIKAIVTRAGFTDSEVTTKTIYKVVTPTIQANGNYAVSITSETEGATIYYTIDSSDPTTSSTEYTAPLTENISDVLIKAIAVKDGMINSAIGSGAVTLSCATPVFTKSGDYISISCPFPATGVAIYYTKNGGDPTSSSTPYTGPISVVTGDVIKAIAVATGYNNSEVAIKTVYDELEPIDGKYLINSQKDFEIFVDMASTSAGATYHYILQTNVDAGSSITIPFSGIFDGNYYTISGLSHPLFNTVNGGVVKNVMLNNVHISGTGNVGAIAGEASGYTRIYNCGILPSSNKFENETSSVSSSDGYCGGLVGWLKDDSRVINCFSYANITGGTTVAGIVGYNNFASTAEETDGKYTKLKTAVVNCMFYGNITGGTTRYPVYGGNKILNNTATGINNYDFYRAEANLGLADNSHYNCSWPAQEEYLTKYEYYRYLLNSNRELCGWWVGAPSAPSGMLIAEVQAVPKDASLMAKWVLDPSIAPYPILKAPGKYYSAINQDPDNRINPVSKAWESRPTSENTITTKAAPDTEGQKLGSITVTINKGGSLSGSSSKSIPITAMDIENNDFCYGKIQLPYYNSIFGDPNSNDWTTRYGGNYGDQVVVGWEITSVTGGTEGTLVKNWQDGYNFADRDCTNKDKERIFAQGGYYYVPNGVTAISITAKWADATYLDNNDNYYDRISVSSVSGSTANATLSPFAPAGTRSTTLGNGKTVKKGAILSNLLSGDVYEKAIVLVGNNQNFTGDKNYGNSSNGFTVMSADFDLDDEPDYSLIWQLGNQTSRYSICPIRFDFLPVIEMGMAMKEDGSTQYYSLGCYRPLGHFEVTETSLIHFGQFEFGNSSRTTEAPLILNGGIYDQYTKGTMGSNAANDKINYIIIGGNVRIPSFTPGAHPSDRASAVKPTRHCSLNVMGGNIDYLYLTGNYNEAITPNKDNPHCYIDGGNFKQVAAAGKEGIDGDVFFNINHSVIEEFYGGSTMDQSTGNNFKTVKGDINVTVDNSKITKYCGGPKFGNMNLDEVTPANNKKVTTNATGTTFGVYYGGGNGGTSYVQYDKTDVTEANAQNPYDWNGGSKGKLNSYNPTSYRSAGKNYVADYEMEIVNSSAGTDANKGIFRTYFYAAQFSATNTGPITNNLTNCKVLTSFYGGGNLGGVIGDVESTLTDTEVMGSAFGAGYSASVPEVTIYNKNKTAPTLNVYTGIITPTPDPDPTSTYTTYTWTNKTSLGGQTLSTSNPAVLNVDGVNYFYTEEPLENLGTVKGKVTLKIEGTTTVKHSAYGGGEESGVDGNTEVNVTGGTIGTSGLGGAEYGNVYGGGKGKEKDVTAGLVKGNTNVSISGTPTIIHNVYGGGAYGSVGDFTYDASGMPTALKTANTGACTVTIKGGTIGSNGDENGMVFGSSRGDVATPEGTPAVDPNDRMAWVYSTQVNIGTENATTGPHIKGSVYGSGENGHTFQNTELNIYSGTIGIPTGSPITDNNGTPEDTSDDKSYSGASYPYRGNVYGGGCGTDKYYSGAIPDGHSANDGKGDKYNPLAGIVKGTTTVNITGGQVVHNVYGAGAMGSVGGGAEATSGKTTINITGGRIGYDGGGNGHIFGAARGEYGVSTAASGLANVRETSVNINYTTTPAADNDGKTAQLIAGSVFGGGEAGTVKESVAVNMTGGLILKDLYGGGALADTQTSNWDAAANENAGGWADAEKKSTLHTTTVRLTGGRVGEEVFGGGLGEAGKPAYVWGDVLVDLNGTTSSGETGTPIAATAKGCVVGQIFGCNNINGTPKGDVMVHVYATQSPTKADISTKPDKNTNTYDVTAVYGGGNQAAYNPVTPHDGTSGSKTQVIIEGCTLTSINTVYGGGNAAAVPETNVDIKGAYEIGYLFGGGNGKDDIAPGVENPGADVGTPDHGSTTYGTGNANTLMEGGLIHEAYGGSNTRGTIKGSINQTTAPKASTDPEYCCDLEVEKIVGAGKYADIDGDVTMTLSCQPSKKVDLLFAGADEANVNGNITLNITNGHFGKVFGGNNLGGAIKGKITVNVEETGCQPIKIDDLYLGSNEAPYSVFGYYESDEIHSVTGKKILKPRTSADDTHTPVENPASDASHSFPYAHPELNIISCTYIGNVFGGGFGEGAVMYANPTVNVNMEPGSYADTAVPAMMTELQLDVEKTAGNPDNLGIIRNVFGGGDAANIAGDTHVNIATEANKSAYIIGSVFGGGNAADVLGNTNVTVSGGYIFNGIFGGGYAGSVGTFTRSTAAADVNIYGHTTHDGCIGKPVSCATGTGKCTVLVNGGQIGPISVATEGMNRSKADGGPVPEGWVWGAGQGLVEDPATHPDTHFSSYVGSTDVTIGGTALVMESIIGGGEFGRVLGNTLVKIEGGQIGIGAGKVDGDNKPIRYTDDQFVNPLTTTITNANALAECSHYPYGKIIGGKKQYLPYDPYYDDNKTYADNHNLGPASTSDPSDGKTWIGCVFGGGSGYMPFKNASGYEWVRSAGWVEGNSEVRISGGHILTNVYGGNEVTDVKGKSIVKMTGGTIGVPRTLEQIAEHPLSCYLFGAGKGDDRSHFYNYTNTGSVEVEISGGIIYGSVFGGSEDGHVTGDIKVDIKPGAIIGTWGTSYVDGNVFGAGRGFSGNTLTAGNVGGNVTMNISGGNILGSVYGGGRLASVGTYLVPSGDANYGNLIPDDGDDKHGHITINITGGTIGNDKEYFYSPTAAQKAAMPNTTFDYQDHLQYTKGGNVFTAGMGRLYALDNTTVLTSWQKLGQCKSTTLNMTGGTVKSSVYGGGEIGIVAQSATVNINGGTVGTKVVDSNDATKNYYFGSVFGGGKGSTENIEGISAAGTTQGNVEVHLNKDVASNDEAKGAIVNQVFGCNDMNGSPKGDVTVHVYATQNADKDNISTKYDKGTETFDVEAVYGGGNLAAYEPTDLTTGKTNVIIDGCGLTSIRQVYGGGNAASTPATNVEINGTYEILELFGGGNGFDNLPDGRPNPGANVGYKNYSEYYQEGDVWKVRDKADADTKEERLASSYVYGTGKASVNVYGGTVHRVFGGSNTKGNVRKTAVTLLDEGGECTFSVDEAYGGGKSAPMDAEAQLLMACIPGLTAAYGGAEAADVRGNVTLNITNGTFDRVFGGNNISGTIGGTITINVEEIGCKPVKIGELYGGGNQAGYSVYGYDSDGTPKETGTRLYDDPQVNVKSFTSIGNIYGGGYGEGATMVGNPTVNVNVAYGRYYDNDVSVVGENAKTANNYPIPSHAKGKMGAISNVFGGGNAAKVIGNTNVNIATLDEVYVVKQVTVGETVSGLYTRSGAGTTASPFVYTATASTDVAVDGTTYYEKLDVQGVDIRGNVYGGGNNAEVTGNGNVVIGKRVE